MAIDLSGSILESINAILSGGGLVVAWVKLTQLKQQMDDHIEASNQNYARLSSRIETMEERLYAAKK